jgi:hypothetical protein
MGRPALPSTAPPIARQSHGLVAHTRANLESLIDAAEAKLALEAVWTERLTAGHRVGEIFGLT